MAPVGFAMADRIGPGDAGLAASVMSRTLSSLGLRTGDVLTVQHADGGEAHYELAGMARPRRPRPARPVRQDGQVRPKEITP
jgi:hypothetical protein